MKKVIIIFIILIAVQMAYSFIFNSHGTGDCWKSFDVLSSYKGYSFTGVDNLIVGKVANILSNYRMNCDGAGYILLAQDFPRDYFEGRNIFLSRPLYSSLIYLISWPLQLISNSYALIFASAIFLNFILFFFTILFLYLLIKRFVSPPVAFLSSFLLIFSPFSHIWLVQPVADILGAFIMMTGLYLIYTYITRPTRLKLVLFSLIIGMLMLGKMFFAVSFFILFLVLFFKRYKEGMIFFALHLVPLGLWYLTVTKIWGLGFYVQEVSNYKVGVWLFDLIKGPWYQIIYVFLNTLPHFINVLVFGFMLIPLIFAIIGFPYLKIKHKNIIFPGLIISFLSLFFITNLYIPRHAFLLFPIIYPVTVLGIDGTAKYFFKNKNIYRSAFIFLIYLLILLLSNMDIYKIFEYDGQF